MKTCRATVRQRNPDKDVRPSEYFPGDLDRLAHRSEDRYLDAVERGADLALGDAIEAAERAWSRDRRKALRRLAHALEAMEAAHYLAVEVRGYDYDEEDPVARGARISVVVGRRDDISRAWDLVLSRDIIKDTGFYVPEAVPFGEAAEALAVQLRIARRDRDVDAAIYAVGRFMEEYVDDVFDSDVDEAQLRMLPADLRARVQAGRDAQAARYEYERHLPPEVAAAMEHKRTMRSARDAGVRTVESRFAKARR